MPVWKWKEIQELLWEIGINKGFERMLKFLKPIKKIKCPRFVHINSKCRQITKIPLNKAESLCRQ